MLSTLQGLFVEHFKRWLSRGQQNEKGRPSLSIGDSIQYALSRMQQTRKMEEVRLHFKSCILCDLVHLLLLLLHVAIRLQFLWLFILYSHQWCFKEIPVLVLHPFPTVASSFLNCKGSSVSPEWGVHCGLFHLWVWKPAYVSFC